MRNKNIRFLIYLILLVIVMSGQTMLAGSYIPQFVAPYWFVLILFFTIVNIVVYFTTMDVKAKDDMGKFTNFYMGTTVVKLLTYLALLITSILIFPEDKKAYVFTFLAYYLCFTFFETYFLTKK